MLLNFIFISSKEKKIVLIDVFIQVAWHYGSFPTNSVDFANIMDKDDKCGFGIQSRWTLNRVKRFICKSENGMPDSRGGTLWSKTQMSSWQKGMFGKQAIS